MELGRILSFIAVAMENNLFEGLRERAVLEKKSGVYEEHVACSMYYFYYLTFRMQK